MNALASETRQESLKRWLGVIPAVGAPSLATIIVQITPISPPWPESSVSVTIACLFMLIVYAIVTMFLPPETTRYSKYKRLVFVSLGLFIVFCPLYFLIWFNAVVNLPGHNRSDVIGSIYTEDAQKYVDAIQQEEGRTPDMFEVLDHHENSVEATFDRSSVKRNCLVVFVSWFFMVEFFALFWIAFINFLRRRRVYKRRHLSLPK